MMTVYPYAIDDDSSIIRIDDNITELGGTAINQLRDASFSIEKELGIHPAGTVGSVANRLDVSLNPNGTIKASALTSIGLVTLPIIDSYIADNAGIKEIKLSLDYNTSDLHTLITSNSALLTSLSAFAVGTNADLLAHIAGSQKLSDGSTLARHVASQIDINGNPTDTRDPSYAWSGLQDKSGTARTAVHVAEALLQINDDLTGHENATADAHPATAITVDTSNFIEIPQTADTVQKALDAIDDAETLVIGVHRANMHANGIPRSARSSLPTTDGYSQNVVPPTPVRAFLVPSPYTSPQDSNTHGDDLIQFIPDNTNYQFDSYFTNVRPGDRLTINYGNGLEALFLVESYRFIPGTDWFVRINGTNLFDGYDAYARIDRPLFDKNIYGVLAVAAANNDIDNTILGSVIVGSPRGASATGFNFEPNQLDSTHYLLYLSLYPTGNPTDYIFTLPGIDVTGNAGITPGQYTIDSVVQATNDALRAAGYNYRFIAYNNGGEFGIMLADAINNVSFSIINGERSGAVLDAGSFTNNVIGDASGAGGNDALGFGRLKANLASPLYTTGGFTSTESASNYPTKVIVPLKGRNYVVNGVRRDTFADTYLATGDGYWNANLTARTVVAAITVETTYTVDMCLEEAGLAPGKTIVVQPTIDFSSASYSDHDYGRFIIKEVSFTAACGSALATTVITVVSGVHGSTSPIAFSSSPTLPVKLYFGEDSVGFNAGNVVDASGSATYNRLHKIYVDENGNTFSHERVRMPQQVESGDDLNVNSRWKLNDVSPKLRGFIDDGSSNFRHYVRFYVLSYDTVTGEFDGYIGKRTVGSPVISNYGAITTARKNVPARFYDETNVDFIELTFFDETASPGIGILSANVARYVDIEVFPPLELDNEVMLLASVEVNANYIELVRDRRESGSVSEENFTVSAIDFVRAGDRYLHSNGVIRGLNYLEEADGLLQFNGGLALVNGAVVAVNNGNVQIPVIYSIGDSKPATVNWAVCVNESGDFEPIIITSAKTQFFATSDGVDSFYVPSVSFTELVSTRKDLTIVAMVVATIASITVSVSDARRFVINETANIPFTWTGGDVSGNFTSIEQIKNWINNLGYENNKVMVRGLFDVSSTIDLTGFNYSVVFEGNGNLLNVTSPIGLKIGSNVKLKELVFEYNPTGITYGLLSRINSGVGLYSASTTAACLLAVGDGSSTFKDIVVDKCSFSSTVTSGFQRPSFILFQLDKGDLVDGLTITNNKFYDGSASPAQSAIAIVNSNDGVSAVAATISNVFIDGNICNREQGIHLTSAVQSASPLFPKPGLQASNVRVSNNECGVIGFLLSNDSASRSTSARGQKGYGLVVSDNTARYIGRTTGNGYYAFIKDIASATVILEYGPPSTIIKNNRVHWIHTHQGEKDDAFNQFGQLLIDGNTLDGYDSAFLTNMFNIAFAGPMNYAIHVDSPYNYGTDTTSQYVSDIGGATITNNKTMFGYYSGTQYGYDACIVAGTQGIKAAAPWFTASSATLVGATITNNDLSGINDTADAIYLNTMIALDAARGVVSGNRLVRDNVSVFAYISSIALDDTNSSVIVVDNFFDSPYTDIGSTITTTIVSPSVFSKWVFERNKNQTKTITLVDAIHKNSTRQGSFSVCLNAFGQYLAGDSGTITGNSIFDNQFHFVYTGGTGNVIYRWNLPLDTLLPNGTHLVQIYVAVSRTGTSFDTIGNFTTTLSSFVDPAGTSNAIDLTGVPSAGSTTMIDGTDFTSTYYISGRNLLPLLRFVLNADSAASASVGIDALTLIYRW